MSVYLEVKIKLTIKSSLLGHLGEADVHLHSLSL